MGRLSDMGIPVFRTDKQGTIIAVSDGTGINWNQDPCNDYSAGGSSAVSSGQNETTVSDPAPAQTENTETDIGTMVWIPATGEKYHSIPNCGRMNPDNARQISKSDAEARGYQACKKCW